MVLESPTAKGRPMLPPGGRTSTTPAIRSTLTTKPPARDGTPPASARVSSRIPRPMSQKKPFKRPSRMVPPPKKTSSENVINVKSQTLTRSTLEGEEVKKSGEQTPPPAPPPPPPVEGEGERNEQVDEDREEVPKDLDRTLQQDMIANEINELNEAQPPEGYVAVSRTLETIMEDGRCMIVCMQEFMAAPVPVKPNNLEAYVPRTPPWITYCSLVLQVFVFLLVALLTICTMIINYDRLMAAWDPSYVVESPVRVVEIEDPTGFELLQRWFEEFWKILVDLVSYRKQSTK